MAPRTILYTGKGGVGKTSVAACTALRCARSGMKTIVLSTDPAHSLSESLETDVGDEPTPVEPGLWAQEVRAQSELERQWSAVQDWLGAFLMEQGVDRIAAEELTVPPGMDELFSLLQLKRHHEAADYDVVIVDCAPTGETLRLLSFPDVARWWLEKVFPYERQLLSAARPLARAVLDLPLPDEDVIAEVRRLVENLIEMNGILRDRENVTVRLVANPDRMVVAEAMRTFTYLNLYGFLTDAVVVNRIFGDELEGSYFDAWRRRHQEQLELIESAFAPVPMLRSPYFEQEVRGTAMLDRLGDALFQDHEPAGVLHDGPLHELETTENQARLRIALPFARRGDLSLKKIGLELIVGVGGQKRTMILPAALANYRPAGARLTDGTLEVIFDLNSRADADPGDHAPVPAPAPARAPA